MRIVVVISTSTTRIAVYDNKIGIVRTRDELRTHHAFGDWLKELTAKLRAITGASDETTSIMVVVPGALYTNGTLVGMGPQFMSWENQDIHHQMHRTLGFRTFISEAATALLARAVFPHIALCWDAGITAATTSTGTDYLPIVAGHLPARTHKTIRYGCGGTECVDLSLGGSVLALQHGDIESLEKHTWSAAMELFLRFVVAPLAISRPGASFVLGGSMYGHAMSHGLSIVTAATGWMNGRLHFVTQPLFSEPAAADPLTDGGLVLLNTMPLT